MYDVSVDYLVYKPCKWANRPSELFWQTYEDN